MTVVLAVLRILLVVVGRLADGFDAWEAERGSDRGATLVEYALIVAGVAAVCIAAVQILGDGALARFVQAGQKLGQDTRNRFA